MGNALLIAEHLHGKFPKTTLNGLTAAKQAAQLAGGKAFAVVLADKVDALAADLAGYGVDVVAVEAPAFAHYLADTYTAAIAMKPIASSAAMRTLPRTSHARSPSRLPRASVAAGTPATSARAPVASNG